MYTTNMFAVSIPSSDAKCEAEGGTCITVDACDVTTSIYKDGLCAASTVTRVCCVPFRLACTASGGRCGLTVDNCFLAGRFPSWFTCDDGTNCCFQSTNHNKVATHGHGGSYNTKHSSHGYKQISSTACTEKSGTCMAINDCLADTTMIYKDGLCTRTTDTRVCCIPRETVCNSLLGTCTAEIDNCFNTGQFFSWFQCDPTNSTVRCCLPSTKKHYSSKVHHHGLKSDHHGGSPAFSLIQGHHSSDHSDIDSHHEHDGYINSQVRYRPNKGRNHDYGNDDGYHGYHHHKDSYTDHNHDVYTGSEQIGYNNHNGRYAGHYDSAYTPHKGSYYIYTNRNNRRSYEHNALPRRYKVPRGDVHYRQYIGDRRENHGGYNRQKGGHHDDYRPKGYARNSQYRDQSNVNKDHLNSAHKNSFASQGYIGDDRYRDHSSDLSDHITASHQNGYAGEGYNGKGQYRDYSSDRIASSHSDGHAEYSRDHNKNLANKHSLHQSGDQYGTSYNPPNYHVPGHDSYGPKTRLSYNYNPSAHSNKDISRLLIGDVNTRRRDRVHRDKNTLGGIILVNGKNDEGKTRLIDVFKQILAIKYVFEDWVVLL